AHFTVERTLERGHFRPGRGALRQGGGRRAKTDLQRLASGYFRTPRPPGLLLRDATTPHLQWPGRHQAHRRRRPRRGADRNRALPSARSGYLCRVYRGGSTRLHRTGRKFFHTSPTFSPRTGLKARDRVHCELPSPARRPRCRRRLPSRPARKRARPARRRRSPYQDRVWSICLYGRPCPERREEPPRPGFPCPDAAQACLATARGEGHRIPEIPGCDAPARRRYDGQAPFRGPAQRWDQFYVSERKSHLFGTSPNNAPPKAARRDRHRRRRRLPGAGVHGEELPPAYQAQPREASPTRHCSWNRGVLEPPKETEP